MMHEIGLVGLGKMGGNVARRLMRAKWHVWGYNQEEAATRELVREGLKPADSLGELVAKLTPPRLLWVMVPANASGNPISPVDEVLLGDSGLVHLLEPGDTVVDAGNSFYQDSVRRAGTLGEKGIHFIDVGMSGGPAGALQGACLMIGGQRENFERLHSLWTALAVPHGYRFFEGVGAGHYVKMIHNGIEYGMMQAIAEGFTLLHQTPNKLSLRDVAAIYNHGSVIQSRLLQWLEAAFESQGEELDGVSSTVAHTGEGAWTVKEAQANHIAVAAIEAALMFRENSASSPSYTGKILTALRNQFGGHSIK